MMAMVVLVAIASTAAAFGSAYLVRRMDGVRPAMAQAALPEDSGEMVVPLPRFLTDLADRQRKRYVDVSISLVVADDSAVATIQGLMPRLRDAVLGHLRSQGAEELVGSAGKERLAEELAEVLRPLVPGGIQKIYVTDMLVQ